MGVARLLVRQQDSGGAGPGDLVVAERIAGAALGSAGRRWSSVSGARTSRARSHCSRRRPLGCRSPSRRRSRRRLPQRSRGARRSDRSARSAAGHDRRCRRATSTMRCTPSRTPIRPIQAAGTWSWRSPTWRTTCGQAAPWTRKPVAAPTRCTSRTACCRCCPRRCPTACARCVRRRTGHASRCTVVRPARAQAPASVRARSCARAPDSSTSRSKRQPMAPATTSRRPCSRAWSARCTALMRSWPRRDADGAPWISTSPRRRFGSIPTVGHRRSSRGRAWMRTG